MAENGGKPFTLPQIRGAVKHLSTVLVFCPPFFLSHSTRAGSAGCSPTSACR